MSKKYHRCNSCYFLVVYMYDFDHTIREAEETARMQKWL
jgi:hypothetical protein